MLGALYEEEGALTGVLSLTISEGSLTLPVQRLKESGVAWVFLEVEACRVQTSNLARLSIEWSVGLRNHGRDTDSPAGHKAWSSHVKGKG